MTGKRLFIFGAGGFGREVAWLAEETLGEAVTLSFAVDDAQYVTPPINDLEVRLLSGVETTDAEYVVGIGDPEVRRRAAQLCESAGLSPGVLIHPRVERSRRVACGGGTIVCAGSILTTNITLGRHVHVNLDCTIGHDVVIEDFATLSPGVHVSGNVTIEEGAFIGTGVNIINGAPGSPLVIGKGAVVAAGACVTKSVEPGALMVGVPATRKR